MAISLIIETTNAAHAMRTEHDHAQGTRHGTLRQCNVEIANPSHRGGKALEPAASGSAAV